MAAGHVMQDLLGWPHCAAQRGIFLVRCVEQLKAGISVPQSLRLMMKTVSSFPGKPRKKRTEEYVAIIFDSLSISYIREFTIRFSHAEKRHARPDFRTEMPYGWIIWEVDEKMHAGDTGECQRMRRMYDSFRAHNDGCLHIVRFNPDAYRDKRGLNIKPTPKQCAAAIKQVFQYAPTRRLTISYDL